MSFKIAVATNDGLNVDKHFGRAKNFQIFQFDQGQFNFIETRNVNPLCGEDGHEQTNLVTSVENFKDCRIVMAVYAGPPVVEKFTQHGITFLPSEESITISLEKLAKSRIIKQYEIPKE